MTTTLPVSDSRIPTETPVLKESAISFNSAAQNASRLEHGRTLAPVVDCPECVWNDFGATEAYIRTNPPVARSRRPWRRRS